MSNSVWLVVDTGQNEIRIPAEKTTCEPYKIKVPIVRNALYFIGIEIEVFSLDGKYWKFRRGCNNALPEEVPGVLEEAAKTIKSLFGTVISVEEFFK